ncbi:MAG: ABC transporter ATP-binding protein [Planctomycetaceae bacterium]
MTSTTVLTVTDFHKAYEGVPAVSGVTFTVQPGQILGVIGPNGAGKTTTMRALAAVIPPTSGSMHVGGFDVEKDPVAVKQRLALVPDDPGLFSNLTVDDHLAFTAAAYRVTDAARKADSLLKQFGLEHKRSAAAKDLSRGMRQKLAICCAWLYDPIALLLDEPLTGLDPAGIRTLKKSIRQRAAAGAGVMISSHLLAMVEDVCTHILLIDQGRQTFFGTVAELRLRYADLNEGVSLEEIFFAATGALNDESPHSEATAVLA